MSNFDTALLACFSESYDLNSVLVVLVSGRDLNFYRLLFCLDVLFFCCFDLVLIRSFSDEVILVPHLDACSVAFDDRLEQFKAFCARSKRELKGGRARGLTLDLQVLNRHVKLAIERLRSLPILKVESGAHGRVEQLIIAVGVVKWGSLFVVELFGSLHHFLVGELALVCHVLQTVLTAGLGAS